MQSLFIAIALCFIPLAAFIVCLVILVEDYVLWKSLVSCFLGIVTVAPIAFLQFVLFGTGLFQAYSLAGVLVSAIVINGLIEELVKAILLFFIPQIKADKKVFFLYSLTAGLALGCVETFIYLISGSVNMFALRLVTAVVLHTLCAGLDGLFVFGVRTGQTVFAPVVFSVFLHGVYNYFAGFNTNTIYFYLSFAAILFAAVECRIRYTK